MEGGKPKDLQEFNFISIFSEQILNNPVNRTVSFYLYYLFVRFWNESTDYTPESRRETHIQAMKIKKQEEEKKKSTRPEYDEACKPRVRQFFGADGHPYSFNDPKVDYDFNCDDDLNVVLTVHVFKHMDTSLIDVDIQPKYVRVTLKGKALQLAFLDEVKPDSATAKRSQITGYLVITMPKLNPTIREKVANTEDQETNKKEKEKEEKASQQKSNYLEFDDSYTKNRIDLSSIVANNEKLYNELKAQHMNKRKVVQMRENSEDFVDNLDVPPLL